VTMPPEEDWSGAPLLTPEELQRVCQLLYLRTGMTFNEQKRYYIERRIKDRVQKLGLNSVSSYLRTIFVQPAEMEALINAFTINETYFYREESQLAALGRSILPLVVSKRRPGELVRIWSLPCASGEEPYSIAIWLLENWPLVDAWHIEIVGSDIDTDALARARAGRYGERALARLPADIRERYFRPESGQQRDREIIDDLKESVLFTQVNLIDPSSVATERPFDVIFCRNLLIYFDNAARQMAAANLFDRLSPGGFLCVSHTESMTHIDDRFEMVRFGDAIVYRRR
jgi:chemotaxis protein methyltransferase CheR